MGRLDSPQILQRVSKPKVLFTGMKLRSYPAFAGPTTLGCLIRNDALRQQATEVFSHWVPGHHGLPLSSGSTRRSLSPPRFQSPHGAQFRLLEDDNGIDVVCALHLDLTGRPVPAGHPVEGRTYMGRPALPSLLRIQAEVKAASRHPR